MTLILVHDFQNFQIMLHGYNPILRNENLQFAVIQVSNGIICRQNGLSTTSGYEGDRLAPTLAHEREVATVGQSAFQHKRQPEGCLEAQGHFRAGQQGHRVSHVARRLLGDKLRNGVIVVDFGLQVA